MTVVHVKIAFTESNNPIATEAGTRAMLDFINFMGDQKAFPGIKPIYVAWKDQRPPAGYGFFECQDAARMQDYLRSIPGQPTIEIEAVSDLKTMAKLADAKLGAG